MSQLKQYDEESGQWLPVVVGAKGDDGSPGFTLPIAISDVSSLVASLAGKANAEHGHQCGNASTRYGGDSYDDYDYFVDVESGADGSDGTSWAERREIFRAVQADSIPGESIGLLRNQLHLAKETIDGLTVGQWRPGTKPTLDYRKNLNGASWNNGAGGNVWAAIVTLSDSLTASTPTDIENFNTYFAGLWFGSTFLDWKVGGASIAANVASVLATPGSFTIHKFNDNILNEQDIRKSTVPSNNGVIIYVHLPDGSDANNKDIYIVDRDGARVTGNVTFDGLKIIGNWSKDFLSIVTAGSESKKIIKNCEILDFGGHGCVGPFQFENCLFRGAARRGMASFSLNRAFSAINLFTPVYYDYDMQMSDLDISNTHIALYGHSAGFNEGYKSVAIDGTFKVRNARYVVNWDDVASFLFIRNGVQCNAVLDIEGVDQLCEAKGVQNYDGGGVVALSSTMVEGGFRQIMIELVGPTAYVRLKNTTIRSDYDVIPFSTHNVLVSTDSASHTGGTLELDNVQDSRRTTQNRLVIDFASADKHNVNLIIKNGCLLGDLQHAPNNDIVPKSITVSAGCTFGFGNRTGPQIDSFFASKAITYSISGQTTIIGPTGTVLSNPGWK